MSGSRSEILAQMLEHASARDRLTMELRLVTTIGSEPDAIYTSAQILRHRIAMALLSSRLSTKRSK